MSVTPLISVLVPCYNVEKYLVECLDSIVAQSYKNLEIICLNDGSTDSTLDIINSFASKDERLTHFFHTFAADINPPSIDLK